MATSKKPESTISLVEKTGQIKSNSKNSEAAAKTADAAKTTPSSQEKPAAKAAVKTAIKRRGRPAGSKNKPKTTAKKTKKVTTKTVKKATKKATATARKATRAAQTAFAQSPDAANFAEGFEQAQEAIQSAVEMGSISSEIAQKMTEELIEFANQSFSQNIEISKDFFNCRTVSDMLDTQQKLLQSNIEGFFEQTTKFTNMMLQLSQEGTQPFNATAASSKDRLAKKFSA